MIDFKSNNLYTDWQKLLRAHVDPHGEMGEEEYKSEWYFTPHDVRRISATPMRAAGVSDAVNQSILGHASTTMTDDLYDSALLEA